MAGRSSIHSEDWWAVLAPPHVLRCTASLKRDGSQCRREAVPGANVCKSHGGLAPAVQAAAAARIQMSVDDAAKKLLAMVEDPQVEAREKIKILHDLLDRGGLAPTSKHLVGIVTEDPIEKLFRELAMDPNATYDPKTVQVQALPAVEAPRYDDEGPTWDDLLEAREDAEEDVVEAELVDEPAPDGQPRRSKSVTINSQPPKHIRDDLERLGLL